MSLEATTNDIHRPGSGDNLHSTESYVGIIATNNDNDDIEGRAGTVIQEHSGNSDTQHARPGYGSSPSSDKIDDREIDSVGDVADTGKNHIMPPLQTKRQEYSNDGIWEGKERGSIGEHRGEEHVEGGQTRGKADATVLRPDAAQATQGIPLPGFKRKL